MTRPYRIVGCTRRIGPDRAIPHAPIGPAGVENGIESGYRERDSKVALERTNDVVQLELTQAATRKAKSLLAASDQPDAALRVAVRNGGCSGMRYELLFDRERRPDDDLLEIDGLRVFVDAESAGFLEGVRIDYSDALNEAGFKVENPKASETCGCGESFSL